MSASVQSLATLLKQTDIEDHTEVLKAADIAVKQNKSDTEALRTRVVALLKLDRYEDALKAVEAGGDSLKEGARLEYAYALYKSGNPSEAAKIASQGVGRGYNHVEAQSRYRTEDFETAAKLYQQLSGNSESDAELDLRINSGAVGAQLVWAGHVGQDRIKQRREDLEAFETAYNAACASIARGDLAQGEVLLKRARDLCSALEDMSDDDKQAELLPITIQQVYVLSRLGKNVEAERLSRSLNTQNATDATTRHIAQVNSIAASGSPTNPFIAQRLVAKDLESLKPDYPFQFQTSILKQDRYAADLQSLKHGGVIDSTASAISKKPSPNLNAFYNALSVVNAAAHAKNTTGKEALKHILHVLEKRPNDVGLILTIVQLYVLTGNSGSATTLLESFINRLEQSGTAAELDVRFAPGLVGAMVSLYNIQNRKSHVQRELAKAATHWRRKTKERSAGVLSLLKAAGSVLLESHEAEHRKLAADIFAELHDQEPENRYSGAGLLASTPQSPSSEQNTSLTLIGRLTSGIDIDALERSGIAQPQSSTSAGVVTRKRPAESTRSKNTKKIRASRMSKDYDASKTPDPERWLPLRDRSTYRPKGKKGKARANLLSQGTAPTADSDGSRPGTPGGEIVKPKQQGGGGGGKKKKGRK